MLLSLLVWACAPTIPPAPPMASAPIAPPAQQATLEVHIVADGVLSSRLAFSDGGGPPLPVHVYSYVLSHPTAGTVVIDPGYGRQALVSSPGAAARQTKLQMRTPLADILEARGQQADHLLVTHMHVDHSAAISDFPGAALHIDPAEWDFGLKKQLIRATDPPPGAEARTITPLVFDDGPLGPFPAHADVFGDGILRALPAPGHTPGHTAFLISLAETQVLLTGDAAWFDAHWQQPAMKGAFARRFVEVDWEDGVDALWRLRALSEQLPGLIVLSGHDPANVERLEPGRVYR